ncbi:MAG: UxaA family hydrolase [Planctomycetes bacterium]|nr:UxaA family hydrolase [Planctomycetota bacterium]
MSDTDNPILILSASDNVGTAIRAVPSGTAVSLRGAAVRLDKDIPFGHKVAVRPIRSGEKIVKYGAPIGSATRDIAVGEHVHVHNIKSDYIPTFGKDGSNRMFAK